MQTLESILVGFEAGIASALTMVMLMKMRLMPMLAIYVPKEQFEKMKEEDED